MAAKKPAALGAGVADIQVKKEPKQELTGPSTSEPPFLKKTYDLVDKPDTDDVISWGKDGTSFVVWKQTEFSQNILPSHFKHNNFSSFVRQLNTYGFRKIDPDKWEFANENFIRGRKELLNKIHRRKPTAQSHAAAAAASPGAYAAIELGNYGGVHDEIDALKRDKNALTSELMRLHQAQQASDQRVRELQGRLDKAEQRQEAIVSFLARVAQNPSVLQQMFAAAQTANLQRISGRTKVRKKRRAHGGDESDPDSNDNVKEESGGAGWSAAHNQIIQYQPAAAAAATAAGGDWSEHFFQQMSLLPPPDEAGVHEFTSAFSGLHMTQHGQPTVTIQEQPSLPSSPPLPFVNGYDLAPGPSASSTSVPLPRSDSTLDMSLVAGANGCGMPVVSPGVNGYVTYGSRGMLPAGTTTLQGAGSGVDPIMQLQQAGSSTGLLQPPSPGVVTSGMDAGLQPMNLDSVAASVAPSVSLPLNIQPALNGAPHPHHNPHLVHPNHLPMPNTSTAGGSSTVAGATRALSSDLDLPMDLLAALNSGDDMMLSDDSFKEDILNSIFGMASPPEAGEGGGQAGGAGDVMMGSSLPTTDPLSQLMPPSVGR